MEEETTGQSRLFVILSIALIGLLVLGLLGIGGVFVVRQNMEEQALAARPTPTVLIRLPDPVASATPTRNILATNTPAPTPTNTPVVVAENADQAAIGGQTNRFGANLDESGTSAENNPAAEEAAPAQKPAPTAAAPSAEIAQASEVPDTGLGLFESLFLAAGLIVVFFVARRMRLGPA